VIQWLRRVLGKAAATPAGAVVRELPFQPGWQKAPVMDVSFGNLSQEGYRRNSAVFSCVRVHARNFPEPPLIVKQRSGRGWELVADHPAALLCDNPNPRMGQADFWGFVITWQAIGGNCYIWKARNRAGEVVELWPLHDGQVKPVLHPTEWISGYVLDDGSARGIAIPRDDIIHLRWAPDPFCPQTGLSPIVAIAREVDTDNEAARYVHALLRNDAVPRTVLVTKEGFDAQQRRDLRKQFRERYGGSNRGDIIVIEEGEIQVQRIGMNLDELADAALRTIPESRIAASMEVPAILAGLNTGLERATFSNAQALSEFYTEQTLVPRWRLVGGEITRHLLPEFGDARGLIAQFDTSGVRALADDADRLWARINLVWLSGLITQNEGRIAIGYEATDGGDSFKPAPAGPGAAVGQAGAGALRGLAPGAVRWRTLAKGETAADGIVIDDAVLDAAAQAWDDVMPARYRGLLTAEPNGHGDG
jgi:HK97 family phage portal protein